MRSNDDRRNPNAFAVQIVL
jgi:hypothetical protein